MFLYHVGYYNCFNNWCSVAGFQTLAEAKEYKAEHCKESHYKIVLYNNENDIKEIKD